MSNRDQSHDSQKRNEYQDGNRPSRGGFGGLDGGRGFTWTWILVLGLLFLPTIVRFFTGGVNQVTFNEFLRQVEQDNVEAVTIAGNRVEGTFGSPVTVGPEDGIETQRFIVHIPLMANTNVVQRLQDNGVPIYTESDQQGTSSWAVILNLLP
ncbi:MAG: ATP-dependent metallopeptidase FtsH/Yme1/Tma family protein, partial [Spirochaetota bacterium]